MKESNCCCETETLAIASVPLQKWCKPYNLSEALEEGTIFPCLNLPFFRGKDNCTAPKANSSALHPAETEQEELMLEICRVGFALNDLTLYLDTHPDCPEGLPLFYQLCSKRQELLEKYAAKYNPLTQDSMNNSNKNGNLFQWSEGPLPWEGGCI